MEHNYPHCWRCREPLIYRAMEAWYFNVVQIKDQLIEQNAHINWTPATVKLGRFGNWLEGARDWNISRNRYWGTPIPVWECDDENCTALKVAGSCAELEVMAGKEINDLHKEFLDEITVTCECGCEMHRVPEVLDCWFESAAMPFGQCHYPFENKEWFETHYPADFIVEYPGQIRGWFYYLHVLAVALMNRPSFKNCLVHGTLLAADGSKISKSKKNYTDPLQLLDKFGADALRIYLLNSPAATMADLNFTDSDVEKQIKGVMLPIWNAYSFFVTYANIDAYTGDPQKLPEPEDKLDHWILAQLFNTEKQVKEAFETYHLNHSLTPVLSFIDDLTNWYIRRSRKRFWAPGMNSDKLSAYDTLYYVLNSLVKLLAPSAPFISEEIFRNLSSEESVHLAAWPHTPDSYQNEDLIQEISLAQKIATLGLALRQKSKMKVRQPLAKMQVVLPMGVDTAILDDQLPVLKEELNVKTIEFIDIKTILDKLVGDCFYGIM